MLQPKRLLLLDSTFCIFWSKQRLSLQNYICEKFKFLPLLYGVPSVQLTSLTFLRQRMNESMLWKLTHVLFEGWLMFCLRVDSCFAWELTHVLLEIWLMFCLRDDPCFVWELTHVLFENWLMFCLRVDSCFVWELTHVLFESWLMFC